MRRPLRASFAALALTCGSLVGLAGPAHAADATVLYVKGALPGDCSDAGSGSADLPFCTVGAAARFVTAGQTVEIGWGNFAERVTLTSSGTPEQPITFRGAPNGGTTIGGANGGLLIDGQHDIRVELISFSTADTPAIDIRDSSRIAVHLGAITMSATATAPAIALSAVTDSTMSPTSLLGRPPVGVSMDAGTSGVTVGIRNISPGGAHTGVAVRMNGRGNKVVNAQIVNYATSIVIEPEAVDVVVANNSIRGRAGNGIHNRGAVGTAITNNTVSGHCLDGIRVDGGSSGVSLQNNEVLGNGSSSSACGAGAGDGVQIGLYDGAVDDTTVDYNNVWQGAFSSPAVYALGGTRMGQATFRAATGQAAHDIESSWENHAVDSANSAAPGYPATDRGDTARADDPVIANTGAGPISYADRGADEIFRWPAAVTDTRLDLPARTVRVDASPSIPGFAPISSYEFDFGDGTVVTQASPVASHQYAQVGEYTVNTKVVGTDGKSNVRTETVSILPVLRTVGLLALQNLRFVKYIPNYFDVTDLGVTPDGLIDIADAGSGQVALVARANGRYVLTGPTSDYALQTLPTQAGDRSRFTLTRNGDGSISLRAVVSGLYIGLAAADSTGLSTTRSTITTMEKFHEVRAGNAARTFKAYANSKFVSAESAGAKPLIASRPAANTWESFDIVDLGNGQVALFARANNKFVAAEAAGTAPLQARRLAVGGWERFTMISNSDGSVSLKAAVNSKYVAAEAAGAEPLLAGRTAIGTWEKFTLG